jgi:hypothetical protein
MSGTILLPACAADSLQEEMPQKAKAASLQGEVNVRQNLGALSTYSRWGFICARAGKDELPATITVVEPGTPAYQRGLMAGDRILNLKASDDGITLTIERATKIYSAQLTNDLLQSSAQQNLLKGKARREGLRGRVANRMLEGDIWKRTLSKPLVISIASGGGEFTNSFNGKGEVHDLLMQLADEFAAAINGAKFPPGACGICVHITKPHSPDVNLGDNGDPHAFYADCTPGMVRGFVDPEKVKIDPIIDRKKLTLTPLDLRTDMGGSHVIDSFNNGVAISILDYTELSEYQNPMLATLKAGGPLVEQPTRALRPTVQSFSLPGSFMAHSFDKNLSDNDQGSSADRMGLEQFLVNNPKYSRNREAKLAYRELEAQGVRTRGEHTARLVVVPDRKIPGLCRPVMVRFSLGGSRLVNSFNRAGSVTILANEFLDRLTSEIKPSVLAGLDLLSFGHGGSAIENSFDRQ